MQTASNTRCLPNFLTILDEIKWLQPDADLGFTNVQHRLGVLYLQSASDFDGLYQAYKWLFISVVLGNESAKDDLILVNMRLDYEQIDEAYLLAEDWFSEKFDDDLDRDECNWSQELMKWRFALPLVH